MILRPLALALALSLAACQPSAEAPVAETAPTVRPAERAAQLQALYADYWEASLKLNPLQATDFYVLYYERLHRQNTGSAERQKNCQRQTLERDFHVVLFTPAARSLQARKIVKESDEHQGTNQ